MGCSRVIDQLDISIIRQLNSVPNKVACSEFILKSTYVFDAGIKCVLYLFLDKFRNVNNIYLFALAFASAHLTK